MTNSMTTTVVILAGGSASRMGQYCLTTPKVLLPVGGEPFLFWLLVSLRRMGLPVLVAAAHLGEQIRDYCGVHAKNIGEVQVMLQGAGLGTGGALCEAARKILTDNVIVLNGDTIVRIEMDSLRSFHEEKSSLITQVVAMKSNQDQGKVLVDKSGLVVGLSGAEKNGTIAASSSGCYVFNRDFLVSNFTESASSLESEILPKAVELGLIQAFVSDHPVFDFGTCKRYEEIRENRTLMISTYGECNVT